jgi:hypothetical protein
MLYFSTGYVLVCQKFATNEYGVRDFVVFDRCLQSTAQNCGSSGTLILTVVIYNSIDIWLLHCFVCCVCAGSVAYSSRILARILGAV